ncbi:hypothetical protein L7F22_059034 [Adiantum nelumboides]|nr:hypothetical protein [Adiantum nelumboides]
MTCHPVDALSNQGVGQSSVGPEDQVVIQIEPVVEEDFAGEDVVSVDELINKDLVAPFANLEPSLASCAFEKGVPTISDPGGCRFSILVRGLVPYDSGGRCSKLWERSKFLFDPENVDDKEQDEKQDDVVKEKDELLVDVQNIKEQETVAEQQQDVVMEVVGDVQAIQDVVLYEAEKKDAD